MDEVRIEDILEIAKEARPDLDWESENSLMDDELIDSFDVVAIATELMEKYDIEVTADDVEPENFNSVECIFRFVQRRIEEE